jgi:hypothetical protein
MNRYRVRRHDDQYWLETRYARCGAPWTIVEIYPSKRLAKAAEMAAFKREIAAINERLHVTHTGTTGGEHDSV